MEKKNCNKWLYRILSFIVLCLSFLGMGPLYMRTKNPNITTDQGLVYTNMVGHGCRGKEEVCPKSVELKNNLWAQKWLGFGDGKCKDWDTAVCVSATTKDETTSTDCKAVTIDNPTTGHACKQATCDDGSKGFYKAGECTQDKRDGLKKTCQKAKDDDPDAWELKDDDGRWASGTRRQCNNAYWGFASSALWITSVVVLGLAFVITLASFLILRCECFKGWMNKFFRIVTGAFLILGGTFSALAVGLHPRAISHASKCGAMIDHDGDLATAKTKNEDPCMKQTPGFFAYCILVVACAWIAGISAFGAACCCDPDKKDDDEEEEVAAVPGHAPAPTGTEEIAV